MQRDVLEARVEIDRHTQQIRELSERVIGNERAALRTQTEVMQVVVDLQAALALATEKLAEAAKALVANQQAQVASLNAIQALAAAKETP